METQNINEPIFTHLLVNYNESYKALRAMADEYNANLQPEDVGKCGLKDTHIRLAEIITRMYADYCKKLAINKIDPREPGNEFKVGRLVLAKKRRQDATSINRQINRLQEAGILEKRFRGSKNPWGVTLGKWVRYEMPFQADIAWNLATNEKTMPPFIKMTFKNWRSPIITKEEIFAKCNHKEYQVLTSTKIKKMKSGKTASSFDKNSFSQVRRNEENVVNEKSQVLKKVNDLMNGTDIHLGCAEKSPKMTEIKTPEQVIEIVKDQSGLAYVLKKNDPNSEIIAPDFSQIPELPLKFMAIYALSSFKLAKAVLFRNSEHSIYQEQEAVRWIMFWYGTQKFKNQRDLSILHQMMTETILLAGRKVAEYPTFELAPMNVWFNPNFKWGFKKIVGWYNNSVKMREKNKKWNENLLFFAKKYREMVTNPNLHNAIKIGKEIQAKHPELADLFAKCCETPGVFRKEIIKEYKKQFKPKKVA